MADPLPPGFVRTCPFVLDLGYHPSRGPFAPFFYDALATALAPSSPPSATPVATPIPKGGEATLTLDPSVKPLLETARVVARLCQPDARTPS